MPSRGRESGETGEAGGWPVGLLARAEPFCSEFDGAIGQGRSLGYVFGPTWEGRQGERESSVQSRSHLAAFGAAVLAAQTCLAGFTSESYVDLAMTSTDGNVSLFNDNSFSAPGGGGYTFMGGAGFGQSSLGYAINLSTVPGGQGVVGGSQGDTDVVNFSINVTNTSGTFHVYTLFISTGITTPWNQGTLVSGDVFGTLTELGGTPGSADMTSNGNLPLMTGLIDGVGVLAVSPGVPFSIPATPEGTTFFAANAGTGPMSIVSSYGLILTFGLEGDDRVELNGSFRVTYVPAPASLLVLAAGVASIRRRRR